jgi:hypothetical protein
MLRDHPDEVLESLREAARATGHRDQLDIQEQPAIQATG